MSTIKTPAQSAVKPERMKNDTNWEADLDRGNARIKEMKQHGGGVRYPTTHSSHIAELGSSYESNSVSTGKQTAYHPVVTAARAPAPKGK